MWLKFGVALTMAIAGFIAGWLVIKRQRRPSACDDALLCWDEQPVSAWRQDPVVAVFIAVHGVTVIVLAVLFLLHITVRERATSLFLLDPTPYMLAAERSFFTETLDLLATSGLGIAWFLCGSIVAFPFARRWIRPIRNAITTDGVVSGPYLWAWSYFSHFTISAGESLIRLYLRRMPEIASMAWRPPNKDVYSNAVALLRTHLPSLSSQPAVPWFRRRSVLFTIQLLAITIPFIAMALFVYAFGFTWGWLYYTFAAPLVMILGLLVFSQA